MRGSSLVHLEARDDAPRAALEPREETLDVPPAFVATGRSPVSSEIRPMRFVRHDHLGAPLLQPCIERVASREPFDEASSERFAELRLMALTRSVFQPGQRVELCAAKASTLHRRRLRQLNSLTNPRVGVVPGRSFLVRATRARA